MKAHRPAEPSHLGCEIITHGKLSPPLVVGVVSTPKGLVRLSQKTKVPCDIIELRVDCLFNTGATLQQICAAAASSNYKLLITPRDSKEGGVYEWKPSERIRTLRDLLPHAAMVDVELASAKKLLPVVRARTGVKAILSAHDFNGTPHDAALAATLEKMWAYKPNFLKLACTCVSTSELGRLAIMQHLNTHLPLALMGMGPLAGVSRTMLAVLGSRLVYGYLDEPTAPGQPDVSVVEKSLKRLGLRS